MIVFEYRFVKFLFDYTQQSFIPLMFNCELPYNTIISKYSEGISSSTDFEIALMKYGPCNIVVPEKSIPFLLVTEVLNPFYIFQL